MVRKRAGLRHSPPRQPQRAARPKTDPNRLSIGIAGAVARRKEAQSGPIRQSLRAREIAYSRSGDWLGGASRARAAGFSLGPPIGYRCDGAVTSKQGQPRHLAPGPVRMRGSLCRNSRPQIVCVTVEQGYACRT